MIQEFSNIPLEHTPDPEPTVYEGIPFIWGFGEAWGMLQGYVGVLLDMKKRPLDLLPGDVFFSFTTWGIFGKLPGIWLSKTHDERKS